MNRSLLPVLISLLFNICFLGGASFGAGPSRIAVIDYSSWPYELNTRDDINCASRLTILSYVNAISKLDITSTGLNVMLGLKNADSASVVEWKKDTYSLCRRNFHDASVNSGGRTVADYGTVSEIDQLLQYAANVEKTLPDELKNWFMDIDQFTKNYVYEQARLAALFPKISSEIRTYDSSEIDGNQYNDLHFLFTFDDGPSGPQGSTDQLLAVMQQKKIPGLFFVLGERLNQRLQVTQSHDAAKLYTGMILGSHGYTHVSHAKQKNWVESIYKCDSLINVVSGKKEIIPFRPPYGQRIPTAYSDLSAKSSIVLWNIDTQDWNATLSKEQIYGRTLALMTLWRRGIILFHDIHEKAKYVVPAVVDATQGSGIIWTGSY